MSGLAFILALITTIIGYKRGWFDDQTKEELEDMNDVAIMTSLMTSDDQD